MTDFIIVGRGLAASVLAHTFHQYSITFRIIGTPGLSHSSLVAAGIWNPVVFKRLTPGWLAYKTIPYLNTFYSTCENKLGQKILYHRPIIKPFIQEQEKQLWMKKSMNELDEFLGDIIDTRTLGLENCNMKGQAGIVKQSGNVDVTAFISSTELYFKDHYVTEEFDHSVLDHSVSSVSYKHLRAKNIIFCEGHLVKNNPLFNRVPLKPAKGEILTISADHLELKDTILNKGAFILQTAHGTFKTGATYEWNDLSEQPSQNGLKELEKKLGDLITADYTVLKHEAGIRPAVTDRRLVIGPHPAYPNCFIFNGLGTKGVMLAPYFANNFVLCYLQKQALHPETDVKRFYNLFERAD